MSLPTTDPAPAQQRGLVFLSCLALITGLITGFGAIFFRGLIAAIHNLFFLGTFSVHYDANIFTPAGPWGPFIILAPVIGGMVVTGFRGRPRARWSSPTFPAGGSGRRPRR